MGKVEFNLRSMYLRGLYTIRVKKRDHIRLRCIKNTREREKKTNSPFLFLQVAIITAIIFFHRGRCGSESTLKTMTVESSYQFPNTMPLKPHVHHYHDPCMY